MARGGFYSLNSLQGVYALVVDEDDETRAALIAILRYCGALVRGVASIEEAQGALRETVPDVLVLSVRTPAGPAFAMIRGLRALRPEQGGKIPVVGVGAPAEADEARTDGFDGYLEEPIDPWSLCRLVSDLTT
jgi:CheY-like chemotaxis protein